MKKISKILALALAVFMLVGLMPGNVFADGEDTRTKISTITATSNLNDIAQLGHTVQYPTFTITDGSQARFNSGRCFWKKMNGTTWEDYREAKFVEGAYRYQIEIRVDGANGTTHVLDENGVTVTVDGEAWTCSKPNIDSTYSSVWAKSQVFVVRDSSTPLTPHNVNISVNPADAGKVTASPNSATLGQKVDLTITANEGYEKENVTLNGSVITGTSFTMPNADANVVVNFKKDESKNTELKKFSAQTLRSGSGFANLAFNPAFTPENRDYTASVDKTLAMIVFNLTKAVNEQTITAKMNGTDVEGLDDTNISNWHPNLQAGENVFEFTVTAKDGTTKGTYKLTVTRGDINEAHNITVVGGTSPISKAFEGDFVSVKANDAPTGMVFDKWTSVPAVIINDLNASNTQFKMPNSNVTLTANYKPDPETTAYLKDIKVDTKATTGVCKNQALTFKPETLSYTVDVNEDQEKLDLALHLIDQGQTVEVKKGSKTMTLDIISSDPTSEYLMDDLANGSNVYTINVTAKTGGKTETYTVTINRGTPPTPPAVEKVTITFNANGHGTAPSPITVNKGTVAAAPADPTDANYDFGGWYKEAGCTTKFDFTQAVNASITVYAKWTAKTPPAVEKVTITFNANGHGTAPSPITVNKGTVAAAPADPTDANYDFGGWYKEAGCTTKFDFTQAVNASITVYAKWTKKAVTPPTPTAHSITVIAYSHGSASASKSSANPGDLISISVYPDHGYVVDEIYVKDAANALISRNDYNFYMPNSAVNVYVHFKPYFYDYDYDYYRPYRPHRHTEDKKEDKKSEDKAIDKDTKKPVEKTETEVILVIGSNNLDTKVGGVDSFKGMDVAPYIKNGRTMLPIRYIAEALGMSVDWDAKTRTVIIQDVFYRVEIPLDTMNIIVNGITYTSDVKPEIKNGRTMMPIANIARALGLVDGKDIIWDASMRQVIIKRIYDKKEN